MLTPSPIFGVYSPTFTLQPGETVTYSAYVLVAQNTGRLTLYRRTSAGVTYIDSETIKAGSQWQRVQLRYTAGQGTVCVNPIEK